MLRFLMPTGAATRAAILAALCSPLACGGNEGGLPPVSPSPIPTDTTVVLAGAGDIAPCGSDGPELTASLLDGIGGGIFTAGDNTQASGTVSEFVNCFGATWGRHRDRIRPSPGNHDYGTAGAAAYYVYFGANAGPIGVGYYSYTAGAWHVVALNSNLPANTGSAQERWLRADLAANPAPCTLAYWHHPVFSSGSHGNDARMRDVWRSLYAHGVDVVVNGHDHIYERFAPQDPDGRADERGIRQFIVGTGGGGLGALPGNAPNSEVRSNASWGVLVLTLSPFDYEWEFVPVRGGSFRDSGSGACVR
jgi:hypothetical protein